MKKTCLALLTLILVFVSACSPQPAPVSTPTAAAQASPTSPAVTQPASSPTPPLQDQAGSLTLSKMSLEQNVGQVFLIGFSGTTLEPEVREMIEKYHVGGILLGPDNLVSPLQTASLVRDLQDAALKSGHPGLLIAVEQVGGSASPLSEAKGFTTVPAPLAIAATGEEKNAFETASLLAGEMNLLGINTAFAPLLDLNDNPNDPLNVLSSFGILPELASPFAVSYIDGLQNSGVLAIGRSFPGLPLANNPTPDTNGIPTDARELELVKRSNFGPFQEAISAGIGGLMTANRIYLALEPDPLTPASLSRKIQTDLLRGQMGFLGLIVSGPLQQDLLAKIKRTVPEAAVQALQAGADLLPLGSDQAANREAILAVQKSAQAGQIPAERLNDAAGRILKTKTSYKILQPAAVDPQNAAAKIGQNPDAAANAAAQSITLLRDTKTHLPLEQGEKVLVVATPPGRGLGSLLNSDFIDISLQPTAAEIEQVAARVQPGQKVVLVTSDSGQNPQQAELVKALQAKQAALIVVAASGPFDLLSFKEVGTYLATYGLPSASLRALAGILSGASSPGGHLPIALQRLYQVGAGMSATTK